MATPFSSIPDFLLAGFPALWITTHEPEQTQGDLINLLATHADMFSFACWDCASGMKELQVETASPTNPKSTNPLYPLSPEVSPIHSEGNGEEGSHRRLIFLHNYHRFLDNPLIIQTLYNAIVRGEHHGITYCILGPASPASKLPEELSKAFTLFDYPLPSLEEITTTCESLLNSLSVEAFPDNIRPAIQPDVPQISRGLTRRELRNTLSLSLIQKSTFDPTIILDLKAQEVAKSGVLRILQHEGDSKQPFANLAGLQGAKDLITRLCSSNPLNLNAKGILLVGVPGGGKSALARAAGSATNRTVLRLDMGSLMHKHVGESEERMRTALAIAEATSPNILMIDEIEKGFAGHSGDGDSGVMRRMFGYMLTWMEERTAPVFLIATSNDVGSLPPEFLRAGRWSCEIFVDLPTPAERKQIWELYLKQYMIPDDTISFSDDGWTGGEIKQCCELAAVLQVPLHIASRKVRINSRVRKDQIENLRTYAEQGGVLCATTGEPYTRAASSTSTTSNAPARKAGRMITPKESNN